MKWLIPLIAVFLMGSFRGHMGTEGSMNRQHGNQASVPAIIAPPETTLFYCYYDDDGDQTAPVPGSLGISHTDTTLYHPAASDLYYSYCYLTTSDSTDCVNPVILSDGSIDIRPAGEAGPTSGAAQRAIYWYDLDTLVPQDALIIDAYLCFVLEDYSAGALAAGEGFQVALDTVSARLPWLGATEACFAYDPGTPNGDAHKQATWSLMNVNTTTRWPIEQYAVNDRWDFGITSDLAASGTTPATGDTICVDVKKILQYYSVYRPDNVGFYLIPRDAGGATSGIFTGKFNAANGLQPTLVVKYSTGTKKPVDVWNNKSFAFSFQSDDGYRVPNCAWTDTMEFYDKRMTLFLRGDVVATGADANFLNNDTLQAFMGLGHEIGNHSDFHAYPASYETCGGMPAETCWGIADISDADSLATAIGRYWMMGEFQDTDDAVTYYAIADSATRFGSHAYPAGGWTQAAEDSLIRFGYKSARIAGGGIGAQVPDWCDGDVGTSLSWYNTTALFAYGNLWSHVDVVGDEDANYTEATIQANLEDMIGESWADGQSCISLFAHDFKGRAEGYPTDGLEREELGYILRYLINRGDVWIVPQGAIVNYYRATHTTADDGYTWTLP